MRSAAALVFVFLSAVVPVAADDAAVAKEFKALAGTWKLVSIEADGTEIPKGNRPELSFTLHTNGKSKVRAQGEEFETQATIDPSKKPKTIDIEYLGGLFKGQKQYGIYKVEGDRWTVFSTPPGGKPEDRPKEFDSKKAKGAALIVWERVKDEKK